MSVYRTDTGLYLRAYPPALRLLNTPEASTSSTPPTGIILFPLPSHHHYLAPQSATCILHLHPIVSPLSRALAQLFRDSEEINTCRPPHLLNVYSSEQWIALFLFFLLLLFLSSLIDSPSIYSGASVCRDNGISYHFVYDIVKHTGADERT